jgi:hypothetical protein
MKLSPALAFTRNSQHHQHDRNRFRKPLKHPFWRIAAIAGFSFPIGLSLGISRLGMSLPLPHCLFQAAFGFPSPSCGLTRSFIALASGDWQAALEYHLFGPLLAAGFLAIAAIAIIELITRQSLSHLYTRVFHLSGGLVSLALLLGYYGLRLWARQALPNLPGGFEDTALWQHFLTGALVL